MPVRHYGICASLQKRGKGEGGVGTQFGTIEQEQKERGEATPPPFFFISPTHTHFLSKSNPIKLSRIEICVENFKAHL